MAFNGSGTFVRVYNFATDKTNLVPVTASRMDGELDGIATGLSTAIAKDGQTPTTARIPFAAGTSAFSGALAGVSYAQTNDPNTGVYFPAADQVSLAAGGVAVVAATATTVTVPVDLVVSGSITYPGYFPAGTKILFYQASAPTGWTAVAQNDKALRVVTAGTTGGTAGGTNAFSTVMAQTTSGSHVITQAELPVATLTTTITDPGHTHSFSNTIPIVSNGASWGSQAPVNNAILAGPATNSNTTGITASTALGGSGTGHTHTMTMAVQYVDVIIASKD